MMVGVKDDVVVETDGRMLGEEEVFEPQSHITPALSEVEPTPGVVGWRRNVPQLKALLSRMQMESRCTHILSWR